MFAWGPHGMTVGSSFYPSFRTEAHLSALCSCSHTQTYLCLLCHTQYPFTQLYWHTHCLFWETSRWGTGILPWLGKVCIQYMETERKTLGMVASVWNVPWRKQARRRPGLIPEELKMESARHAPLYALSLKSPAWESCKGACCWQSNAACNVSCGCKARWGQWSPGHDPWRMERFMFLFLLVVRHYCQGTWELSGR